MGSCLSNPGKRPGDHVIVVPGQEHGVGQIPGQIPAPAVYSQQLHGSGGGIGYSPQNDQGSHGHHFQQQQHDNMKGQQHVQQLNAVSHVPPHDGSST